MINKRKNLTLISIECVFKRKESNKIKIELLNDKNKKIKIYFDFFWNKDTPEGIIQELIDDAGIEINNKYEFISFLTILNNKNSRILKIKNI